MTDQNWTFDDAGDLVSLDVPDDNDSEMEDDPRDAEIFEMPPKKTDGDATAAVIA